MVNYKYKLVYETFGQGYKAPTEKKFEDYKGMQGFLGMIVMISRHLTVYQKIKGKYELIHSIDGHMYYPDGIA